MAESNGNTAESKAIGKQELIRRVAERVGKSRKETTDILDATLNSIRDSLKNGEEVRLVGFGSFKVRTSAERTGINPQTKERITVGPKQRVRFAPGKELSDAVSGK
jgi:nucleoid DNA-binding protein